MECSICYDAITAETGKTVMACGHEFHFRCMASWFGTQCDKELPENCPCCRHVAGPLECLPECEDHESLYSDDEDDEIDDEESEWREGNARAEAAAAEAEAELARAQAATRTAAANDETIRLSPSHLMRIHDMRSDGVIEVEFDRNALEPIRVWTRRQLENFIGWPMTDADWAFEMHLAGVAAAAAGRRGAAGVVAAPEPAAPEPEPIQLDVAAAREVSLTREQLDKILHSNGGSGVDDALWDVVADKNFHYAYLKEIIEANGGEFFGVDWAMVWSEYGPNSLQKIYLTGEQINEIIRSKGGDDVGERYTDRILTKDSLNRILLMEYCPEVSSLQWADLYSRFNAEAPAAPLTITWQRVTETRWERTVVMNPETDVWDGGELITPPDSLVKATEKAAIKFQAIWRGNKQRTLFSAARALLRISSA